MKMLNDFTKNVEMPTRFGIPRGRQAWEFAFVAIALGFAFSGTLSYLVVRWLSSEEYSHGFFIALTSLYLLWRDREVVFQGIANPSLFGVFVVFLASALLIIGELSAIAFFSQVAFVVALFGLALSYGGYSLVRVTYFPLFYLFFAIPVPYFLDTSLAFRMQHLSAELASLMLRSMDITVLVQGSIMDLGNVKLSVVEQCSGTWFIYPLLGLSVLAAYLFQAPLWQRMVVFFVPIPIIVTLNGLRIALAGVIERHAGEGADAAAMNFFHFLQGWGIFVICALLLVAVLWVFARFNGAKDLLSVIDLPRTETAFHKNEPINRSSSPLFVSVFLLLLTGLGIHSLSARAESIPLREPFVRFPMSMSGWEGAARLMKSNPIQTHGATDYLYKDFFRNDYGVVNVLIAYFKSTRSGEMPYSRRACLPDESWKIVELTQATIASASSARNSLRTNRLLVQKGSERRLVYCWFEARGRRVAKDSAVKWYRLWDALFRNRTDGALVRLTTSVDRAGSSGEADQRLSGFLRVIEPQLGLYIPE